MGEKARRGARFGFAWGGYLFGVAMLLTGHHEVALIGLLGPFGALVALWMWG